MSTDAIELSTAPIEPRAARRTRLNWRGALLPLALVALAEAALRSTGTESDAFAPPSQILAAARTALLDGTLLKATGQTFAAIAWGLAAGGGIGLVLGLWLGLSQRAARFAWLSIELFRPIPSVALIPLAMMAFGFGLLMESSLIAKTCFWPMLIFSQAAVAGVEPRLIEMGRVLGLSRRAQILKILLPAALPRLFVAFRLSVGFALIVAITIEIAANPSGLGYALVIAQQTFHPDLMFAILVWLGLLGWAIAAALLAAERRLFARMGTGLARQAGE